MVLASIKRLRGVASEVKKAPSLKPGSSSNGKSIEWAGSEPQLCKSRGRAGPDLLSSNRVTISCTPLAENSAFTPLFLMSCISERQTEHQTAEALIQSSLRPFAPVGS